MNEGHTRPRQDAARKRWDYLRKKVVAVVTAGMAGVLTVVGVLVAIAMLVGILFYLNYIPYGLFNGDVHGLENHLRTIILVLLGSVAMGLIARFVCRDQMRKVQRIEYVPPVAEQLAALPAEEILVRGSDPPAATPDELLRAAHAGTETTSEELLHPTENSIA